MFKNLLIYKFEENSLLSNAETVEQFTAALSEKPLTPCLTQELESIGWLPVFKEGAQYAEKINNAIFIRLGIESKQLPNAAIKTAVEKKIKEKDLKQISRSEMKELHEIVTNELLPNALVVRTSLLAYVDLEKGWLVVDAPSTKKSSILTSYLRKTLGTLPIVPFLPERSINNALTDWATYGLGSDALSMLDDIELIELKDGGGNAKFKGVPIDSSDIQDLLEQLYRVSRLSLSYDDQISFSLAGDFIFKRLKLLERFQEQLDAEDDPILQMQSELYLAVDLYRKVVGHTFDMVNSGQ